MSIYMSAYTYDYNILHLIKICSCCFLVIPLYSNNLSTIATISSLKISEFFPSFFSCSNNFNLSLSSFGSEGKNIFLYLLKL